MHLMVFDDHRLTLLRSLRCVFEIEFEEIDPSSSAKRIIIDDDDDDDES